MGSSAVEIADASNAKYPFSSKLPDSHPDGFATGTLGQMLAGLDANSSDLVQFLSQNAKTCDRPIWARLQANQRLMLN
jgi:hypothetical protein